MSSCQETISDDIEADDANRIQQQFTVTYNYSVIFSRNLFSLSNNTVISELTRETNQPDKLLVVVDDGLLKSHPGLIDEVSGYFHSFGDRISLASAPVTIPGGEACKNTSSAVDKIHRLISDNGICRHSYVMAIGGGAVLDTVGYAVATAHRGVRLVRVPTTVLSQNDSGVGVKNGINAFGKKNFLGTFAPPSTVLVDSEFLRTLCDRDWRAGIAEAVKVALIKDADFFSFIEKNVSKLAHRDMAVMDQVIFRCAQLHVNHICGNGDPFESGSSRPLDFGHWSAHKLEHLSDYRLRHGEAVAIGLALDSIYSNITGCLEKTNLQRILDTLANLGFALWEPELARMSQDGHLEIMQGLDEFREHLGGMLTFTLLSDIGSGFDSHNYDRELYHEALDILRTFSQSNEVR